MEIFIGDAVERATLIGIGRIRNHLAIGLVGLAVLTACSREEAAVDTLAPPTTASGDSTPVTTAAPTVAPTAPPTADTAGGTQPTAPPTEPPVATEAPTTAPPLPPVTTQVVGTAVGGTAGSFGSDSTDPFSEAVRNEDGTCTGWDPPQRGRWTGGLVSGAPVVILERDSDRQIGSGQIGTSAWVDVDQSGEREQWNCEFPFAGEVEGNPETFRIKVADLDPWVARADPTTPGAFVVSVNTVARWEDVPSCTEENSPESVADWEAVGVFWSRGVDSLCSAGLAVVDIERTCRPPGFASESIISVVSAADPSVVIDDAGGRRVDPNDLEPLTEVTVVVATGRPC